MSTASTTNAAGPPGRSFNHRTLLRELGRTKRLLESYAAGEETNELREELSSSDDLEPAIDEEESALELLCDTFQLSGFERDVLLMCAGVELDGTFAELFSANVQNGLPTSPTFSLALAALPDAHWSAVTPEGPLRRWRLLEMAPGNNLVSSSLRIDERILHYLVGSAGIDPRLRRLLHAVSRPRTLARNHARIAARIGATWLLADRSRRLPAIQLMATSRANVEVVAAAAADSVGLELLTLPGFCWPATATEMDEFLHLWQRESLLADVALLLEVDGADAAGRLSAILPRLTGPLLLAGLPAGPTLPNRGLLAFDVPSPDREHQEALWREQLTPWHSDVEPMVGALVSDFDFDAESIRTVSASVRGQLANDPNQPPAAALWDTCRNQARRGLDELAQPIEHGAAWQDLVVPESVEEILREIVMHVRQREKVYDRWGFAGRSRRGLGISALFSGVSGTGKTMAAEVLASELRRDLYRVDLSSVVSKYIGETEKNLRRIFDAAEGSAAILLFDEADALFGKRSEVKDSHDRYANVEVSYLLQRMEAYGGLAILTTNMKDALDDAFRRRIRFMVEFPFPGAAERIRIWQRVFPEATPTLNLQWEVLAQLNLSGGQIRNLALNAAMRAADEDQAVQMVHLQAAVQSEYAKEGKLLGPSELAGWTKPDKASSSDSSPGRQGDST